MAEGTPPVPGWVGTVAQLVATVGFPVVVAAALLWFVLFRLDSSLKQIETAERERVQILMNLEDSFVAALERNATRFEAAMRDNIQANRDLAAQRPAHAAPGQ